MDVWANNDKYLKNELLKSKEVTDVISETELNAIFDTNKILKNVDYIFQRSIYLED